MYLLATSTKRSTTNVRKAGINLNKEGSVRNVNGKVYVDFIYLDHRIRESSGLQWNKENARTVRLQLDKIIISIREGNFKFSKVFPNSKKAVYFTEIEQKHYGRDLSPDHIRFEDYAWAWYRIHKESGRVTARTLLGYKGQINLYLMPYFGSFRFSEINAAVLDDFVSWAKKQEFRKKKISNKTVNKCLIPLKMICNHAAIKYNWGATYNPFFGFKKLKEDSNSAKIRPFSIDEQSRIIDNLPIHWKPFFKFAFYSGLRQGEQIALKRKDIDWDSNVIHIRRAVTLNEEGKKIMGTTKNCYSQRTIEILPMTRVALLQQEKISKSLNSKYLFCTPTGTMIDIDNIRRRVWGAALEKAGIDYRPMIQTRHSFATTAFGLGENPLWIAKVMGHRDTDMIIKVYAKYVENTKGSADGSALSTAYDNI